MERDYRNTKYCKKLDVMEGKEKLLLEIRKKHAKAKDIYKIVKDNSGIYKKEFMRVYNNKCCYCGTSIENIYSNYFEVDHFICESKFNKASEAGCMSNIVLACHDCNRKKHDLIIEDSYIDILNTDNGNIAKVFERDDMYYINIRDDYKNDSFITEFYDKLKFSYEARRLDFLLMNIRGLCKDNKNKEGVDKLYRLADSIQRKRNIMNLYQEDTKAIKK